MAGHGPIYEDVQELLKSGSPLRKKAARAGGPLNIFDMSRSIAYADAFRLSQRKAPGALDDLDRLRSETARYYSAMQKDGFDARKPGGDGPGQYEAWEGQNHMTFRIAAVGLTLKTAIEAEHQDVVKLCDWWFGSLVAGVREFNVGGRFAMCGPRYKNPLDEDGEPGDPRSKAKIRQNQWKNPALEELYASASRGRALTPFFVGTDQGELNLGSVFTPDRLARIGKYPFPKTGLLYRRVNFPGGGYRCWFDDTPEARALLNVDGMTTVEMRPGMRVPKRRYDWRPMPPPKEGADWFALAKVVTYGA